MKILTLNCEGKTINDLLISLEEVARLVREGFSSGFAGDESNNFNFTIKEE